MLKLKSSSIIWKFVTGISSGAYWERVMCLRMILFVISVIFIILPFLVYISN
uniref:Uncharacterized protein n=1 Tax=Rhizophora mucronata TaxID=61149 RepID=A0A2P2QGH8_RHIMU